MKKYLCSSSVMKASKVEILFWLYIVVKDSVIEYVLMQMVNDKEHIITYLESMSHQYRNKVLIY
jgi:hypothetical protein